MFPNKEPFQAALAAAKNFSNPSARTMLLNELAGAQIQAGFPDDALESIAQIPNQSEKRSALLHLAMDALQDDRTDDLFLIAKAMIENDPKSAVSVGRLAVSMLEKTPPNPDKALKLIRLHDKTFESDRDRYQFLEKLISVGNNDFLSDIQAILETFSDENYRDWGRLALMKFRASSNDWREAEKIAESFSLPRRSAWAFFELSRQAEEQEKVSRYLRRSVEILETVAVEPKSNAPGIEPVFVQFRILGKAAFVANEQGLGEELFERCESVIAMIPDSFRQLRARLFLAKVLKERGRLDSVRNYIDYRTIFKDEFDSLERSRLIQWFAEAENSFRETGQWTLAVTEAERERSPKARLIVQDEFSRAERIVETIKRFAVSGQQEKPKAKPINDPKIDSVALPGEEFEEFYFSPFSVDDCGC